MNKPIHTEMMLGDLLVLEPVTVLTDWMITAACFYFAYKLPKSKLTTPFIAFFILQGLSTLFGGVAHGFLYEYGITMHQVAWIFAGLAVYALQWSVQTQLPTVGWQISLTVLTTLQFAIFAFFALQPDARFLPVVINTAVALLVFVLPITLYLKSRFQYAWTVFFIKAIGVLALAGIVNAVGFHPFKWFNGNDISHLVIIASMYFFYRGVDKFSQNKRSVLSL